MGQDAPDLPSGPPPLTIMSISPRTVQNFAENKREIVCASARVWHDGAASSVIGGEREKLMRDSPTANIDTTVPLEQQPSSVTTLVRPLAPHFATFPPGFEAAARNIKSAATKSPTLIPMKDEKALLAQFLG